LKLITGNSSKKKGGGNLETKNGTKAMESQSQEAELGSNQRTFPAIVVWHPENTYLNFRVKMDQ
jgi:hypothetical protein